MKINEVVKITGLTKKSIRYYEGEGLISPDVNDENGYREYSKDDVNRLMKVSLLRQMDVPVKDIREMMDNPFRIQEVLRQHLVVIEDNINRMEKSKNIINTIINDNMESCDFEDITERMSILRNYIDIDDKQKEGYIKRQLQRLFPGILGKMVIIHFSPFLNEPIDSVDKEKAWLEVVKFLDEVEDIKYTREIDEIYKDFSENLIEKSMESVNDEMKKLINPTDDELENYKEELKKNIDKMYKDEGFNEYYEKYSSASKFLRQQLKDNGYYDKFVNNLRVLSRDYDEYQKTLVRLQNSMNLKYDENGRVIIDK